MLMQEEERIQKRYIVMYLSIVIDLHYKYYKNEEFETMQQYFNSVSLLNIVIKKNKKFLEK